MRYLLPLLSIVFLAGHACEAEKHPAPLVQQVKPSGVYGRVLRIGFPPRDPAELEPGEPNAGEEIRWSGVVVVVRRLKDKREVERGRSDKYGDFKITLPPGDYEVEPLFPMPKPPIPDGFMPIDGSINHVTVWRGFYTKVEAVFDGGW